MRAVRRDTRRLGDGLDVQPPLEQLLERLLHLLGADEAELRLLQDLIERRPGLARRLGAAKPSVGVDVAPIATPPGVLADLGQVYSWPSTNVGLSVMFSPNQTT